MVGLAATLAFFAVDIGTGVLDAMRLRDHLRQSTYDKLHLTRFLQGEPDLDGDGVSDVDASRMAYVGISMGAVMGTELLSLTDAYSGGVFIMPGGLLSRVLSDPMGSFDQVLSLVIPSEYSDGDERRLFAISQTILDPGDPSTYGTMLLSERAPFAGSAPELLVGVVLDDTTVPNSSTWPLARAIGIDIVPPTLREVPAVGETVTAPVSSNHQSGVTAGMVQFDLIGVGKLATHADTPYSEVGLAAWRAFLATLFTRGTAEIIDPYEAVGLDHLG